MKKKIAWLGLLLLLVGGVYWFQLRAEPGLGSTRVVEVVDEERVYLEIDFGDKKASYSGVLDEGETVLEILNRLAGGEFEIEVKKYDFGSLVMSIDGRENTKDKSWIYFVNGNSGEVGADQKIVKKGDLVRWGYITPIY